MKYYVKCKECDFKIYFQTEASVRQELPNIFELTCYKGHRGFFNNYDVFAESGVSGYNTGTIIGGIIGGAVAGTIGAISGAAILAIAGLNFDQKEKLAVERFNQS